MSDKVVMRRLETGMPGLDAILGGGFPEFSFNLLAGSPGGGKTTLAHQIMFALANPERHALFFTVLGESPLKMMRYQQQFPFFEMSKVNTSIKFVNLSAELLNGDFPQILARIKEEIAKFSAQLIFVDSFRSMAQSLGAGERGVSSLQAFVQRLGIEMSSWQATTFLIGEYLAPEAESSPVFTVADGLVWLAQLMHGDSMIRKIQVLKMRGQAQRPGQHTFRITDDGIEIFPRTILQSGGTGTPQVVADKRLSMGIPILDEMLGGGLPAAYSLLLVGPSGSGKTILATQFLEEGVRIGEPGVVAAFEKSPNQLLSHRLNTLVNTGKVGLVDTRALDLSIDETLYDLVCMIKRMNAKRVVIDSLSGFELSLAAVFQQNFREALYRMVSVLTNMGVTVLMTAELEDRYTDLRFSSYGNAFLADAIIVQRYVEVAGKLKRVMVVAKVRASRHSEDIRFFSFDNDKIVIGEQLADYKGILSGTPINTSVYPNRNNSERLDKKK